MSVFGKSCFECGEKTKSLISGRCYKCYEKSNSPVKEIKPINLKICNQCKKIHISNSLHTLDEIKRMLPNIMGKKIILNEGYTLKNVSITNFQLEGNKLVFSIKVKTDIKQT